MASALLDLEFELWDRGTLRVAGVDEAGRGPLAGCVVAAAVIIDPPVGISEADGIFLGLTDSKRLSESRREHFFAILQECPDVQIGVGAATRAEIDELNILRATHLAMARALSELSPVPDWALVDGRPVDGLPCPSTAVVGGDGKSLSIAAASVVAKVTRDHQMYELDAEFPQYGFAAHKGYGSKRHMQALFEHGPCPEHRRSFRPVREADAIRGRVSRD